jgi:uroporphyrin-III C-methyltransferase / precorrin-2 dehydrogenase / sirohydrochlorin ferrochelatase
MNTLYPMFMNLESKPVLVVGGGVVAEQKIGDLLDAKASVTVIAPHVTPIISGYAERGNLGLSLRNYMSGDVKGFFVVIGATDSRDVQQKIFEDAQDERIPVNIVDVPHLCTFYLSSVFQRNDLKIAVSTNGKSPTLGKMIRDKIRAEFEAGYPELLETLGGMRPDVIRAFPDFESRKKLFERLVRTELERMHKNAQKDVYRCAACGSSGGKAFLVGAGPGDPELMTVKGLKILRSADVVLYDALVDMQVLSCVPENAEKIFVGKREHSRCTRQEEINELLVSKVSEGKRVVRLKGGDPLIFGRGGEELDALRKAGIDVEVVPGITSGIGVPTSLGIPLTNRGTSSSVVFVTGHEDPGKGEEFVDWQNIARIDTIVIYMGIKKLPFIIRKLIGQGLPPEKHIAVIFGGTMPGEVVIAGTLEDIEGRMIDHANDAPGLIVIGDVVRSLYRSAMSDAGNDAAESGSREYLQ